MVKREISLRKKTHGTKERHKPFIKKKLTNMKDNFTDDIKKEKGHKKLWDIVNTLRGKIIYQ